MADSRIGVLPALILAIGIGFAGMQVAKGIECRRASKTTQRCALNFTQAL